MSMNPRLLRPTASGFTPRSISGLALWLDASSSDLYTTDAGPVVAVASPLDIAGCVGWYDASDSATLFDAQSGGSVVTTNGATVARWQDKSGGGRHLTQSTANTGLPTLTTNGLGGRNVVAFGGTGTGAGFTMTNPVSRATHTVIAVYYSEAGGDSSGSIINDGGAGYGVLIARGAATLLEASSGNSTVGSGRIQVQLSPSVVAVGPAISSWLHAGTPGLFQNGPSIGSGTTSGSVSLSRVGYYGVGNTIFRLKGYIAELVIFDNALSTSQRASVEAYLAAKWAIAGVHAPATASSDPVGYWGDKSGNGRHLTQPTSTARPTRVSSYVNGRTALTFDGTDFLSVANSVALGNNTVIMVVREDASANYGGLISYYPPSGNDNNNADGWVADLQLTDNVISLSSGIFAVQWAGAFSLPLSVLTLRRQTDAGNRQIIRANGVTNAVNANASTGTAAGILIGGRFQSGAVDTLYRAKITVCEVLRWDRALTPAEYTRAETALARKWGITLAPQVANADAQDWINRVYANGGTVSSATAAAVNQFCQDLENAPGGSIRDRFFRLNLFCGSFQGAFVPLFRGPSLGGAQYGGATDLNLGSPAFLDVTNSTESTGLAAASGKYLRTGLLQTSVGLACHLAFYDCGRPTNAYAAKLGSRGASNSHEHLITNVDVTTTIDYGSGSVAGNGRARATGYTQTGAFWLGINPSSTSSILYKNGASAATGTPSARTAQSLEYYVFGLNDNGSLADSTTTGRSGGYSIGLSMDATQAAAYSTAMQAFQTALTRNV
jgi:hypothetical protein